MKISKKIFACVLTVCMLLTMFAGVLSANAAVTGTATIGTLANPVTAGTASVSVPVTLNVVDAAIGGADLYIAFPANVTVSATVVTTGYSLEYLVDGEMATEGPADLTDDGVVHFVLLASDDAFAGASEVAITLTIGTAALAAGKYDITIAEGTLIGTTSEIEVDVPVENITDGGFTVAAEACKHAEKEDVVTKEATCTETGLKNIVCVDCKTVITPDVEIPVLDHNYVDGACTVCGAEDPNYVPPVVGPVEDDTLTFVDKVVTVTSTVNIRYRINKSVFKQYASFKVFASGKEYSFETANLYNEVDIPETEVPLTKSTTNVNTYLFEGIAMCSLGLNIDAYIKAYDANGNYVAYSPKFTVSPESALRDNLAASTTDAGRASIIELLNMAAAAQVQFAANKADTDLAAAVAEGKLVNKGLPESIVTEVPELTVGSSAAVWESTVEESFISAHTINATATLTAAPNIRVYVGGRDKLDASKLRVVFTYYDPDPSVKKEVTKTVEGVNAGVSGKRLTFDIPSFEFHNSNAIVTAKVYYDVADDGESEVIATINYSVETYLSAQLASSTATDTAKDLAAAIAKFGLAFRLNKGIA